MCLWRFAGLPHLQDIPSVILTTAFVLVRGTVPEIFEVISMLMSAGAVYLKCGCLQTCLHSCPYACPIHMSVHMCMCISSPEVRANICTHVHTCPYKCLHMYMRPYTHTQMCVCPYICLHKCWPCLRLLRGEEKLEVTISPLSSRCRYLARVF